MCEKVCIWKLSNQKGRLCCYQFIVSQFQIYSLLLHSLLIHSVIMDQGPVDISPLLTGIDVKPYQ